MQFKKYTAASMREALQAIKRDLGADAMIVATRQLDAGLFKKPRLEVTAALPAEEAPAAEAATPPQRNTQRASRTGDLSGTLGDYLAAAQQQPAPRDPPGAQPAAERYGLAGGADDAPGFDGKLEPLRQEIRELRRHLHNAEHDGNGQAVLQELAGLRGMLSNLSLRGGGPSLPDAVADVLAAADVDPTLAAELVAAARARAERNAGDDRVPVLRDELVALKQILTAELPVDSSFFAPHNGPRRIALIGPTGVGKTTTLAKIAAHAALVHHRSVALVSLDTYRIAAYEQLRQYASLMSVPVTLARDAAGFAEAMRAYQNVDLLLIDTAGRGTADKSHHSQLCDMFSAHRVQTYLALSAATRRQELRGIVRAFAALDPQALVFTKLDETLALGALVNASRACGVPITFVTHGQRVPEDLGLPDAGELASRLVHAVLDSSRQRGGRRAANHPPAHAAAATAPAATAAAWSA